MLKVPLFCTVFSELPNFLLRHNIIKLVLTRDVEEAIFESLPLPLLALLLPPLTLLLPPLAFPLLLQPLPPLNDVNFA